MFDLKNKNPKNESPPVNIFAQTLRHEKPQNSKSIEISGSLNYGYLYH